MKRRIFALILSALMIMSLAAYNKGESGSPDTGNVKTYDEVNTIRLITGMGSTLERDKDTYDTIISESHPVVLLYCGDENTLLMQHLYPFDGAQGLRYQTYTRK